MSTPDCSFPPSCDNRAADNTWASQRFPSRQRFIARATARGSRHRVLGKLARQACSDPPTDGRMHAAQSGTRKTGARARVARNCD